MRFRVQISTPISRFEIKLNRFSDSSNAIYRYVIESSFFRICWLYIKAVRNAIIFVLRSLMPSRITIQSDIYVGQLVIPDCPVVICGDLIPDGDGISDWHPAFSLYLATIKKASFSFKRAALAASGGAGFRVQFLPYLMRGRNDGVRNNS